jgi:hypothetical protein
MGLVKEWMLTQQERGYCEADGEICADCVTDAALAAWITANAASNTCTFCGANGTTPLAASFDDLVGFLLDGVSFDWNEPTSEGISYISREGGWQAPLTDTSEVLSYLDISQDNGVLDALAHSIDNDAWVERDFYRGNDSQRLTWGWDSFKDYTKHHTRFFFLHRQDDVYDDGDLSPGELLDRLAKMIRSKLTGQGVVRTIGTDENLIRLRIDDVPHHSAEAIGTPPAEFSTQSNRMSPAGIPMFYGAFDYKTANAETYDPQHHVGKVISAGTFKPVRPLVILDLANLPPMPSVFDPSGRPLIHSLRFLNAFAKDISSPIARDGKEHIEYVPTQIVTEYFRRAFTLGEGVQLDGLAYCSSKNPGGVAFVLFCENNQSIDLNDTAGPDAMLRLVKVSYQ